MSMESDCRVSVRSAAVRFDELLQDMFDGFLEPEDVADILCEEYSLDDLEFIV